MFSRMPAIFSTLFLFSLLAPVVAHACKVPAGYVAPAMPEIGGRLVSHVENTTVDIPLREAAGKRGQLTDLQAVIARTDALPYVTGDKQLLGEFFGPKGSRRFVCLSDGSTLVEQVLADKLEKGKYRFRYQVWGYTSEEAQAIDYAVGEFVYTPLSSSKTKIVWTYSFALKNSQFPGNLGAIGRGLFAMSFLKPKYGPLMRGSLANIKTLFENK